MNESVEVISGKYIRQYFLLDLISLCPFSILSEFNKNLAFLGVIKCLRMNYLYEFYTKRFFKHLSQGIIEKFKNKALEEAL